MPEEEKKILLEEYKKANCILEFGSGGSTVYASDIGKKVFSVESNKKWVSNLKSLVNDNVKIHHVDIGETIGLGYPKDNSKQTNWPLYTCSVWERDDFEHPDLILIDGRFRVACFLMASIKIKQRTKILFDDFNRNEYHIVKRYFQLKKQVGRLAVFELEPNKFEEISILIKYFFNTM
jgi:hypothetical protein